ncbi:MAG: hypothetical protein ICV68_16725, partial [Pyrinomonadaceae bacterium]|nr:hypothetical protein [Pyrinomonadaceae bacterium]
MLKLSQTLNGGISLNYNKVFTMPTKLSLFGLNFMSAIAPRRAIGSVLHVSWILTLLCTVSFVHAQTNELIISGAIYEDVNGDSVLDDGLPSLNVRVRVYVDSNGDGILNTGDSHAADVVTDNSGQYSVLVSRGSTGTRYFVAVDSRSITPTAGFNVGFGPGDVWAEQTYGDDWLSATLDLGPRFGGRGNEMSGQANTSDQYRTATTFTNNPYRHLAFVDLSNGNVSNLDWGFSFNAVTNARAGASTDHDTSANRTVQGSLRQFMQNANAIAGPNSMRFVPTVSGLVGNAWRVDVTHPLPVLSDPGTAIDGTAYNATDGVSVRD